MIFAEVEGDKQLVTVVLGPERNAVAEFVLDRDNSYLKIYSEKSLDNWQPPDTILGFLTDGTRVTFLACIRVGGGSSFTVGNNPAIAMRHSVKLFPHWVAIGGQHLTEDVRISAVSLLIDDASDIFYDFDAFGYVASPERHIDHLLTPIREKLGRDIFPGESPIIGYFTGKEEICTTESTIGKISVRHALSRSWGGPKGINLNSQIYIDVQPTTSATLEVAFDSIMTLIRFLEIIAGRPQNVLSVLACLSANTEPPSDTRIYWSYRPRRNANSQSPHPADMPINGGIDPIKFGSIMSHWLAFDATRGEARVRFSSSFSYQNRYEIDRLVGAANMFDILPSDALPPEIQLPEDLTKARDIARAEFKRLPNSLERDSILGALGRLGQLTLKRKVRHRVAFIVNIASDKFPDLYFVADEAINCRNRYVHGSSSRIDYGTVDTGHLAFFTNTLEFVFGASELIEAGWSMNEWLNRGTTMTHPWGAYRVTYAQNLTWLKELHASDAP